jgi:hypothetical protein
MNHSGDCVERFRFEGPFHSFLLNLDPYQLTIINHDMVLNQFSVTYDGQTNQTTNVSLFPFVIWKYSMHDRHFIVPYYF